MRESPRPSLERERPREHFQIFTEVKKSDLVPEPHSILEKSLNFWMLVRDKVNSNTRQGNLNSGSSPWMKLVMDVFQLVLVHMGVNLSCGNVGMAEHFLDDSQVRTARQ